MDDRSWIYRDTIQGLRRMDYCNEVHNFINYTLSNSRNISGGGIKCPCRRCKNKKFLDPNVVTIHLLQKRFMEKYLYWYTHGEPYVPYDTMLEKIVRSIYSSSNVYWVIDNNSNPYQNIVMDAMRMNRGHID